MNSRSRATRTGPRGSGGSVLRKLWTREPWQGRVALLLPGLLFVLGAVGLLVVVGAGLIAGRWSFHLFTDSVGNIATAVLYAALVYWHREAKTLRRTLAARPEVFTVNRPLQVIDADELRRMYDRHNQRTPGWPDQ